MRKALGLVLTLLLLVSFLAGCGPAPTPQIVKQTVQVPVEVTKIVEKTVEVPAPAKAQEWELVNPEGVVQFKKPVELSPRPNSLEGLTIGLRANGKHNSDLFLARIAELLEKQVKGVKVIKLWEAVPGSFGYPLKAEDLQKIVALKPNIVIGSQAD